MNGDVVESFTFSSTEDVKASMSDPVVVLTVILAIVFVVLLIVLIVLIGKKPEKSEDFGESYY
jgi:preprotein translocase subunit SecG